jgi:hypothetical protein
MGVWGWVDHRKGVVGMGWWFGEGWSSQGKGSARARVGMVTVMGGVR